MVKKVAFMLYLIITVVLASATVIEHSKGTEFVQTTIYGAWWFYAIWGAMTLFAATYALRSRLIRNLPVFMLHGSFVVMLLGAITTALTAQRGAIYIERGGTTRCYTDDSMQEIALPFSVSLSDFKIEYYSGTKAAADYLSHLIFESDEAQRYETTVSMNNIASYKGYRFYQSGYDAWGSRLAVSRDVYGIPITYSGYLLMALSLVLMLISPRGAFRRLLNSPILRKAAFLAILSISSFAAQGATNTHPRTLSKEEIELLKDIQVVHNDRVMPLTTLAHDFTLKLLGKTKYKGASEGQFFWGWLLFPTEWEGEDIFEVPLSEKQRFLELRRISNYSEFFTEKGLYKLNHYIRFTDQKSQPALYKELMKLNEKVQLVAMLRSGAMLKIFPYRDSEGHITWYSPIDELPEEMDRGQALFIKNSSEMLLASAASPNMDEFELIATKIVKYQQRFGEESLVPSYKVRAEQWYYALSITKILYRFNLALGILGVILLILFSRRPKVEKTVVRLLKCSMIHAVCLLALSIGLKWYITDRMPLANGYDTMIFLGWCVAAITLYMSRSSSLFTAMGTLLVGFTMLVATIGGMNPQITPLMPVLNSPYLTTHVCFIMLAYTLFAFTFINGVLATTIARNNRDLMERLTIYSRIFLLLGISFLAVGIFIGAVWANVSWGRYWAWDPKEVWALITMMLYAIPLHGRSIKLLSKPIVFHLYLMVVFASVLMTYFGVNFILGGMHSYINS
ncbi:MAG: cytochrome c biogenesis protein CcsA [Rikenellaceae bacterium]